MTQEKLGRKLKMRQEDGFNAGWRNIGRLALASIPYVLGAAAAIWLGVWIGIHNFRHQLSQEERAAIYTGAKVRPTSKMAVDIAQKGCVHVTRADVDGSTLLIYAENDCHEAVPRDYLEYHWAEISPNGTVIHQGYTNSCAVPAQPNDSAECKFSEDTYNEINIDDRTDKVRVWVGGL